MNLISDELRKIGEVTAPAAAKALRSVRIVLESISALAESGPEWLWKRGRFKPYIPPSTPRLSPEERRRGALQLEESKRIKLLDEVNASLRKGGLSLLPSDAAPDIIRGLKGAFAGASPTRLAEILEAAKTPEQRYAEALEQLGAEFDSLSIYQGALEGRRLGGLTPRQEQLQADMRRGIWYEHHPRTTEGMAGFSQDLGAGVGSAITAGINEALVSKDSKKSIDVFADVLGNAVKDAMIRALADWVAQQAAEQTMEMLTTIAMALSGGSTSQSPSPVSDEPIMVQRGGG
jgi:hypothetical protein